MLTFRRFRELNIARAHGPGFLGPGEAWSATDWGCALAGEVGELCNMLKKRRRGEAVPIEDIAKEIGDVQTYLDLIASHLNISLEEAAAKKFDEVSDRWGWEGPRMMKEVRR